jgi:polyhydroxyalkanoate synthase subunit PhaC
VFVIENALTVPDAASMLGSPVDLGKIEVDSYVIAGIADHICPWQSCYRTTQLLGGPVKFVLSTSGHIASMVNPPTNPKAAFRTLSCADYPADPEAFLSTSQTVAGSWWTDYAGWLAMRSGSKAASPAGLGSSAYPVVGAAPGTYVHDH